MVLYCEAGLGRGRRVVDEGGAGGVGAWLLVLLLLLLLLLDIEGSERWEGEFTGVVS